MALVAVLFSAGLRAVARPTDATGLTLTRFPTTAPAGRGESEVVPSVDGVATCAHVIAGHGAGHGAGARARGVGGLCPPSSLTITGRVTPPAPGLYGFNLTFNPPLPYPSPEAYARLLVDDHFLFPRDTSNKGRKPASGRSAPLYIPLPPRPLDFAGMPIDLPAAPALSSYEVRVEYVCLGGSDGSLDEARAATSGVGAAASNTSGGGDGGRGSEASGRRTTRGGPGCAPRTMTLTWAPFPDGPRTASPAFAPVPSSALTPAQSPAEVSRRALASRLQTGWGTHYHPSFFAYELLPSSFLVRLTLMRLPTGAVLPPDGLTVSKTQLQPGAPFAVRAGLHSWNGSYVEASLRWVDGGADVNVSVEATVDDVDPTRLTLVATVLASPDASDYALLVLPNFTHGRAGSASATPKAVVGVPAGSPPGPTVTLSLLQGATVSVPAGAAAPSPHLAVGLGGGKPVVLSTEPGDTPAAVLAKTAAHRGREQARIDAYGDLAEVKDAVQTGLAWSVMYDPREGLVAPEFQWMNPESGFAIASVDGDTTEGLFCWDGSFASFMMSMDALDLSLANLVQIVKMRTAAGFIPSYSAGTLKSRDRSNPPVTARILTEIVDRWGGNRTSWVVELLFDDLLTWNGWMWTHRRESPVGLMSWGSDAYLYAPDGTNGFKAGEGGGGATLESGLDNGPVYEGLPFNRTGLAVQDEYDPGLTGLYLMDCLAQIRLAKMLGRADAAVELQRRFDAVSAKMGPVLWNQTAGMFQNKLSDGLAPVERMAPTNLYPLLVGPAQGGPTEEQAALTVTKHLVNPARFGVWPSATPPTDPPPPPEEAVPLLQWFSRKCDRGYPCPGSPHALCATEACNTKQSFGNLIQRQHAEVRYEGFALVGVPPGIHPSDLVPLFNFACGANGSDIALAPAGWTPASGGPCVRVLEPGGGPAMRALRSASGPWGHVLVPLELWHRDGDHYAVASAEGKADAASGGYAKVATLGFVWPPPGSPNATARYGLPAISRDDPTYVHQDYWNGRIWGPMVQITYWGLAKYTSPVVKGAAAGLVAQSKALLLKEWRGYTPEPGLNGSFAGLGRCVYENYGADNGRGYVFSSSAMPMYSWGGLLGFVALQAAGHMDPVRE